MVELEVIARSEAITIDKKVLVIYSVEKEEKKKSLMLNCNS